MGLGLLLGEEQIESSSTRLCCSKAFYCKRGCKVRYPDCHVYLLLRKMLEDKKLFDNIVSAGESVSRAYPSFLEIPIGVLQVGRLLYRYEMSRRN